MERRLTYQLIIKDDKIVEMHPSGKILELATFDGEKYVVNENKHSARMKILRMASHLSLKLVNKQFVKSHVTV